MHSSRMFLNAGGCQGSILPLTLIFLLLAGTAIAAFLSYTNFEMTAAGDQNESIRAFYYAESGLQYGLGQLVRGWKLSSFADPFYYIDYDSMTTMPHYGTIGQDTNNEGYFYTEIIDIQTPYNDARDVTIKSTGMFNDKMRTVVATYRLELEPSRVFDYIYFMNHWGWMQNITSGFVANGNFRANGYFSVFGSSLYLNGHPEYERVNGHRTYKDSGGIYSTFLVSGTGNLNGMGRFDANQHMYEDANNNGILDDGEDLDGDGQLTTPISVPMPNISEITLYENHAMAWNDGAGSSIKIAGAGPDGTDLVVSDAVYGDDPLEKDNVLIWGTDENPIIIDGPVVVEGALIIKGKVEGQGCIYSMDNVYIPDNLTYVDPPTLKPEWNYDDYSSAEERDAAWQAASAAWKTENQDADGIGIFAKGNVIIGDFKNNKWVGEVSKWLNNAANESAERANGLDHMPNTGDESEGDSYWLVDYYTQQDLEDGLIPPGRSVGDVVPGSGEDIDGDGVMDDRINTNEFGFPDNIKQVNWGGWVPDDIMALWGPSGLNWGHLLNTNGGTYMNEINAMLYTNHATVGYFGYGVPSTTIHGGVVSRIEALVLGTSNATWTHDERFTGGGEQFGFLLPRVKTNPELVSWRETSYDYYPDAEN